MSNYRFIIALCACAAVLSLAACTKNVANAERPAPLVLIPATAGFNTVALEEGQSLGLDMSLPGAIGGNGKTGWVALNGIVDAQGYYTAPATIPTGSLDVIEFWSSSPRVPSFVIRVTVVDRGTLKPDAKSPLWDVLTAVPVTTVKPKTFLLPCVSVADLQPRSCTMPALVGQTTVYVCHRKGPFNALPTLAPNVNTPFPVAANATFDVPGTVVQTTTPMAWSPVGASEKIDAAKAMQIKNIYGVTVPVESGVAKTKVKVGKKTTSRTEAVDDAAGQARDVYYQRLAYTDHYKASPDDKTWIYVNSTEELQEGLAREFQPAWLAIFTSAPPKGAPEWKKATSGPIVQDKGYWAVPPATAAQAAGG